MQITLEVAEDIARHIAADAPGLSRAALEALAVEGVRTGRLTTEQVRRLLGFSTRYETDGFLKEHSVFHSVTREDVDRDGQVALEFSRECSSSRTHRRSIT